MSVQITGAAGEALPACTHHREGEVSGHSLFRQEAPTTVDVEGDTVAVAVCQGVPVGAGRHPGGPVSTSTSTAKAMALLSVCLQALWGCACVPRGCVGGVVWQWGCGTQWSEIPAAHLARTP